MERPYHGMKPQGSLFTLLIIITMAAIIGGSGCASKAASHIRPVAEEGLNVVRLEARPDPGQQNTHPVSLSPSEVATILRGVRVWEHRNFIHRFVSGEAQKTRAFRDEEIAFLGPAISKALTQAGPSDAIYFHLSHPTETGEEETTTGWLYVRDPLLSLLMAEVHDRHGPGPDISKYDRRMPDVPEQSGAFQITFEPEEFVERVTSRAGWFGSDQREELVIHYRNALPSLPVHPLSEKTTPSQPSQ